MITRCGSYYYFKSSTGEVIPQKYRDKLANKAKELGLWYAVDWKKKYVKIRIRLNENGVTSIKEVLKKLKDCLVKA